MKILKERLIHLLGGRTLEDVKRESIRSYKEAKMDTLHLVLNTIDYCSQENSSKDLMEYIINAIDNMACDASVDYYKYKNTL